MKLNLSAVFLSLINLLLFILSGDKILSKIKGEQSMNGVRDEILTKATSLFMRNGYHATSTRQLAEHLNIKQPVLYYYFKNKKGLYQQVVTTYSQYFGETLMAIVNQTTTPAERLFAMSEFIINEEDLNLAQLMQDMRMVFKNDDNKELFSQWRKSYLQPFIIVFNEMSLQVTMSPERATIHFMRILTAYVSVKYVPNGSEEIRQMIDIFLHGISLEG